VRALPIAFVLFAGLAHADVTKVALVPFSGLHADEAQGVVERALKGRVVVVKAEEVAAAGAQLIVTGLVDLRKTRTLTITVMDVGGDVVGQLTYPITHGRHLDAPSLRRLAAEVAKLTNAPPPPADAVPVDPADAIPAGPEAPAEPAVAQETDVEKAPLVEDPAAEVRRRLKLAKSGGREPLPPRPVWAPIVELSVGPLVSSRTLSFDEPLPRGYRTGTAGGLMVDATIYPLAVLHHKYRGALAGLGMGVTLTAPFWPSTQVDGTDEEYATSELQVEGSVRWKFALRKIRPRIDFTIIGGGGTHRFSIAQTIGPDGRGTDVGPPDAAYVYVTFGAQARLHVVDWVSIWAAFNGHYVPDAGPAEDLIRYGLATTYGLRVKAGLDFRVKRVGNGGLTIGGTAWWERFAMSFEGTPGRSRNATFAEDMYFGGAVTVGYVY
jgi:hypothetical protein